MREKLLSVDFLRQILKMSFLFKVKFKLLFIHFNIFNLQYRVDQKE